MRSLSLQLKLPALAAVLGLVVAGCSGGDSGNSTADDSTPDHVTYMTSFGNFGRDAYAWVALDKGYFEEEGIEVEIQDGLGGENFTLLAGGQADFIVSDITAALFAASEDENHNFTMLAGIYQRTITGLMALESSGIKTPADLEGTTFADTPGSVNRTLFPTYAELAGIDASTVELVDSTPAELPQLLASGTVDVIGQFAVGEPLVEAAAGGEQVVYLPYSDYLTDLYGVMLFTTKELVQNDPDLARRFTRALLRGLEYAIDHPDETGEILAKYVDTSAEIAAEEMRLLEPYVRPLEPGAPIGAIDPDRIARCIALLEAAGAIGPGLTPESLVSFDIAPSASN
ncbi:MAG: ABC transporter substrate-binding protein [Micromonosporaceae bacterium]